MSLRLPYVIYVAIAGMLIGVLIAPIFREEVTAGAMPMAQMVDHGAHHGTLEVDAVGAPQVALSVTRDALDGWNVTLQTANFTFTPDAPGKDHAPGTGHAHLFIDGVKHARLYSPHFHLPELPPGTYEVTVSLATNAHDYYIVGGGRIEASSTITQPAPEA